MCVILVGYRVKVSCKYFPSLGHVSAALWAKSHAAYLLLGLGEDTFQQEPALPPLQSFCLLFYTVGKVVNNGGKYYSLILFN